jgi:NAD(P)H-hydrate epimerase
MKILTSSQIREADKYTIENEPIASIDLMERASKQCVDWLLNKYKGKNPFFKVFVGPGNNGGDGLAIARLLSDNGFSVIVFVLKITDKFSDDFSINLERLKSLQEVKIKELSEDITFPKIEADDVIIDALFGTGLSRPLTGFAASLINYLNEFAEEIISIDIPSGLFAEGISDAETDETNTVKADYTLTFQFPKLSFLFPENQFYVGSWEVLDINLHKDYIDEVQTPYSFIGRSEIRSRLRKRKKFSHKGTFGHGLIIAGSYGMIGAAILATKAALRTGVGLITTHIPRYGYNILQTSMPEALISIDRSDIIFTDAPEIDPYTAIGIGPGLDKKPNSQKALKEMLIADRIPMVIDADALNMISMNKDYYSLIPENTILTPHPREFERLIGKTESSSERHEKQLEFSEKYKVYIVLKGAHTSISTPDKRLFFNSSGNPGMATAGSGDVLTGILTSLLAQGYSQEDTCLIGVYLHGLAGDLSLGNQSQESMIASDIIENIGKAYKLIHEK